MDEYAAGRTPNPCLRCNEKIKFAAVLDRALALGFDAVATGHYAQLRTGADGLIEMHRAVDMGKDQSYVLGVLTQDQLAHSLFPLGDTTKSDVRDEAAERGLLVADKPDSHDICFVADGDNAGWLREKLGDRAPNHGRRHRRRRRPVRCSASTRAPTASRSASARACALGVARRRRQAALRARHRAGLRHRHRRPARAGLAVDRTRPASSPAGAARSRRCSTAPRCTVQLRAHGDEHRAVVRRSTGDAARRSSCSTRPTASRRARPS